MTRVSENSTLQKWKIPKRLGKFSYFILATLLQPGPVVMETKQALGVVGHTCSPSTWEAGAGKLQILSQPELSNKTPGHHKLTSGHAVRDGVHFPTCTKPGLDPTTGGNLPGGQSYCPALGLLSSITTRQIKVRRRGRLVKLVIRVKGTFVNMSCV